MRIHINAWRSLNHPLAGGSEIYVDRVASGLASRGHEVTLATSRPISEGHPYRPVAAGGMYDQYLRSPITYVRHGRRADVVIDVTNGMAFFTPLWRRNGPTICCIHHVHTVMWRQWFGPVTARIGAWLESRGVPRVYRNCLFVALSQSTATELENLGVGRESIRVVYPGADPPRTTGYPKEGEPLFVSVGRLVPHKRYDLMVRVWNRIRPRIGGGRLVLIGEGPQRELLESIAGPGVEFAGRVSEEQKEELLARAWALIHPSMVEGWGLVVMEAAFASTPTIGFWAPGLRESVVHGETGFLAEDEEEFEHAWETLAVDRELREKLSKRAAKRVKDFTWETTVDEWENVLAEVTSGSA